MRLFHLSVKPQPQKGDLENKNKHTETTTLVYLENKNSNTETATLVEGDLEDKNSNTEIHS